MTLYSVSNGGSPYNIDIFAGAVTDYTGGNLAEIPKPGVETNIIIKGSNALKGVKASVDGGNIYAGSLSDVGSGVVDAPNQYDGNVSITIEKDTSGFGKIYAHGARENREGGYPDVWDSSADLYKVTGRVDVTLQETTNVVVDGATGGAQNANFTYKDDGNGYLCTPTLENIAGIDLLPSDNGTKANLEPYINEMNHEEACIFSHLSVPENTRFSLANIAAKTVIAKTFTGGGVVVFSEDTLQKLCVTEEISGITKVAVGGIDAEGTNSIGSVISDKTYITIEAEKTEDYGFELLPDLNNYTMMLKNDGNGNWVAILEETSIVIGEVEEIADVEAAEVINGQITSEILVPIAVTYATENENNFFGDIPLLVTVNGKETSAESGYSGYQYATGTTDKDIFMGFTYGEEGEVLYIANGAGYEYAVPVGRYEISLMVPGRHMESGTTKTISFILTITCAEHSGGTADCQSQAICEVCGKKYGKLNQQNHAGKAEVKNVKAATCNEEGYTGDIYCNACGVKSAIGTKTAKREHVWNGGVVTREATATQKGEKTYTCSVCKTSRTEEIPAFGLPQIGAEITSEDGTAIYKVTKVGAKGNAVTYKALADKKITSVVVPASITINSITYKVTAIAAGAFAGDKKITSVSVGNNVTAIPTGAFKNCKKLTTVKIGKGVKSIGKKAFYGCKKLKTLKIQTTKLTTKKIGSKAFGKTPKSMKVTLPKKKYKTYKSMLIKKGVNKKAKFKKEKSNTKV